MLISTRHKVQLWLMGTSLENIHEIVISCTSETFDSLVAKFEDKLSLICVEKYPFPLVSSAETNGEAQH